MCPVVWEVLKQWGDDVARIEPLAGGVANEVWNVRVNGHLAVGRLGARSDAISTWMRASRERACRWKMCGITVDRSSTRAPVAPSRLRGWGV
jgi:hypothetical protein